MTTSKRRRTRTARAPYDPITDPIQYGHRQTATPPNIETGATPPPPSKAAVKQPSKPATKPDKDRQKRSTRGQFVGELGAVIDGMDGRSRTARKLKSWREELTSQHGGEARLSLQQRALIESAVIYLGLLDAADRWIRKHSRGAISPRSGEFLPVVQSRIRLSESLSKTMADLEALRPKIVIETEEQALEALRRLCPGLEIDGTTFEPTGAVPGSNTLNSKGD